MFARVGGHLTGSLVACLAFTVQGVAAYAALIAYALVTDADTGGPLAGPFLVLLAGAAGVAMIPLLFLPAGVAGEMAAKSGRLLTKLLVSSAVAGALAMIYVLLIAMAIDAPTTTLLPASLLGALAVLVPTALGVSVPHGALKLMPGG
ncbi:hypothetical protein [Spirillospora sp. NPDC029432]|uniref:hypothetical protein n=1 Tax=Spirillospora sp. NPDC029432 TaxID=3154599 RepID=UPI0034566CAA